MTAGTRVVQAASYVASIASVLAVLLLAGIVGGERLAASAMRPYRETLHPLFAGIALLWFVAHMMVVGHACLSWTFPRAARTELLRRAWLGTGVYAFWRLTMRQGAPVDGDR